MRTNLHNRLLERVREKKTEVKRAGRPSTGGFRFSTSSSGDLYSAIAAVSLQNVDKIAAAAEAFDLPEAKFAGVLIETYLRENAPYRETLESECQARGYKFGGSRTTKTSMWLQVYMSEGLALAARRIRNRTPNFTKLTDYQLISKILELAVVDFSPEMAAQLSTHKTTLASHADHELVFPLLSDHDLSSTEIEPRPVHEAITPTASTTSNATDNSPEPAKAGPERKGSLVSGLARRAAEARERVKASNRSSSEVLPSRPNLTI